MAQPGELAFDLTIKQNPARRLQAIMEAAGYDNPAEFIVKALDVFECAIESGGQVVVEDNRKGKKYIFKLVHKSGRFTPIYDGTKTNV